MPHATARIFLDDLHARFRKLREQGDKTLAQLREGEQALRPYPGGNSIAILVQHLSGNLKSRFTDFLTTDGEKPDRNRDSEFEDHGLSLEQTRALWTIGWAVLFDALESLQPEDVLKTVTIRQEPLSVMDALLRAWGHLNYHIGQMVLTARMIRGQDWQWLTIPPGQSEQFLEEMRRRGGTSSK